MTARDLVVALAVLVVLVLMVGGVSRSCAFAPAGPTIDPSGLPVVDAPTELRELRVPFPVRIPAVPAGWRANSVGQDRVSGNGVAGNGVSGNGVAGNRVVRTGFVTPDGRYLRLLQSDAAEPVLLTVEAGTAPVAARGPVDVGGQRWVVYARGSGEPIWVADVAGSAPVRLLITGSGTEDDVRTLAGAALAGEVLTPAG